MFAVIRTGGKQYRVAEDDKLKIDKVAGEPGEIITFAEVLMMGGDNLVVGTPSIAGASVAAEVIDQGRNRKVIAFKKRRRKNSRRKRGHRQEFTLIRISEFLTDGAKPTKGPKPRPEPKAKPAVEASEDGDTPAPNAKAAAKKPAAKTKASTAKAPASKPKAAAKAKK
jgi:large subunit ribosomal protein L21